MKIITILSLILFPLVLSAQKYVQMEEKNGVFLIPCKLNGIPMKFVYDTGAFDVVISKTEAQFLFKQGLLTKKDIIKKTNYQVANGEIEEGTQILIKEIEIDGEFIKNISATIINNNSAPLLLGQSALRKLGKVSTNGDILIIQNDYTTEQVVTLKDLRQQTVEYYNDMFSKFYDKENFKVMARIEYEDLKIIIFIKEDIDDSNWSAEQKEIGSLTSKALKTFAYFVVTKFICNTKEKANLFKTINFTNIIFNNQFMTKTSSSQHQVKMKMSDYNNLQNPYTELEFCNLIN